MRVEQSIQSLDTSRFETLRLILENQRTGSVTSQEAKEIGESLLAFYELLAGVER